MDVILKPFKDNISEFRRRVEDIYSHQTEQSGALKNELQRLMDLNVKITAETTNLTNALKGNSKVQGDWGEMILDTILDNSKLTKGVHYYTQQNLKDEQGNNLRPDVILNLPNKRQIVIDSKVSLTSYVKSVEAETEAERSVAMAAHIASVRQHVKELSRKKYQELVASPDFVIMFVPVYSALRLAYESDRNLWQYGYKKGVLITTEETLMPFLRMIRIAWTSQEQIANQKDIIATAETILARVSDFCAAHAKMGKKLEEAMEHYETCDKKIRERGQSIVGAANRLLKLGVPGNPKKQIPPEIGMEEVDG
jgi:DNA recombination protein RmuC